ncbi:MAG: response regulator transcription factor [Pigmentiphaga sp.]
MRIWHTADLARQQLMVEPSRVGALLSAVGADSQALARAILALVRGEVDVGNCALFWLPPGEPPRLMAHAQIIDEGQVRRTGSAYAEHFHRADLAVHHVRRRAEVARRPGSVLLCQTAPDIVDSAYRRACYEAVGTRQRFAVYRSLDSLGALLLGFYRNEALADLGRTELRYLEATSDWLAEAVERHWRLGPATGVRWRAALAAVEVARALSQRETQVLVAIAEGATLPSIAARLGVEESSVVTYRNRAFHKLGIRSRHELYARLLAAGGIDTAIERDV